MSSLGLTLTGWSMGGGGVDKTEEGEDWTGRGIGAAGFRTLLSRSTPLSVPSTGEDLHPSLSLLQVGEMAALRGSFTSLRSHSKKVLQVCLEEPPLHCVCRSDPGPGPL